MSDTTIVNPGHGGSHALPPGYELHWYKIIQVLGRGGFGMTYLAEDLNLQRKVAIKEYFPGDFAHREDGATVQPASAEKADMYRWGLERFVAEARTLSQFEHPNIVRVLAVFEENGTGYMVMSYEEGQSLQSLLDQGVQLDEQRLLEIVRPLLSGLALVHKHNFIHRDVKPDNIFIRTDGSPALLDFGSARQSLGDSTEMTVLVTPGYAPVEQYFSSAAEQGPWTDIYGLGATLYRAVTGQLLTNAVERSQSQRDLRPLTQGDTQALQQSGYSAHLLAAIDHAIQVDAGARPQTAQAWLDELPDLAMSPALSAKGGSERSSASKRGLWLGVAALLLVIIASAFYLTNRTAPSDPGTATELRTPAEQPGVAPSELVQQAGEDQSLIPEEAAAEAAPPIQPMRGERTQGDDSQEPTETPTADAQRLEDERQAILKECEALERLQREAALERQRQEERDRAAQRQREADALEEKILASQQLLDGRSATQIDGYAFREATTTVPLSELSENRRTSVVQSAVTEWQSTGVRINRGETYRISTGSEWKMGPACGQADASGVGTHNLLCLKLGGRPLPQYPAGALIARLGKDRPAFYVGPDFEFTAPETATLYLRSNDPPAYIGDNIGELEVEVQLVE